MTPRRELVEPNAPLSMRWQCELLGVNRSSLYYEPVEPDGEQLALKERDARIAKLESVLEESRRAGKRQAAPFSKDKPKRDPKKPGRKPGSKYGRQAVRAIPVPDKTFEAPCPEQCPCGGKVGAEGVSPHAVSNALPPVPLAAPSDKSPSLTPCESNTSSASPAPDRTHRSRYLRSATLDGARHRLL